MKIRSVGARDPERAVRGLVLAAGHGSRLAPITDHCPKPLLPVLNVPLMHWALARLSSVGVTEVAVNVQERHIDLFRAALGGGARFGMDIIYVPEARPSGTGGVLRAIREFWGQATLLVVDADIISTLDLSAMLAQHRAEAVQATIGCLRHPWRMADFTGDIVRLSADGSQVVGYQHKPGVRAHGRVAAAGAVALEPLAIEFVPGPASVGVETTIDLGRDVLSGMIGDARTEVGAYLRPHRFVDFGTPRQFIDGSMMALHGRLGARPCIAAVEKTDLESDRVLIDPTAQVLEPVLIGRGARVGAGSRIVGPAVIGEHCDIAPDSMVHESVVLPGATVPTGMTARGMIVSAEAAVNAVERGGSGG